ncbi:MAG: complement resistance protein TraT [Deltaproteobacteria bacterium]|nr:complement resistance protein TraT [Deltaproteobacteria bacterium]
MSAKNRLWAVAAGLAVAALLSAGCAATYTGIRYKDLQVQNKMSDSIFLDPVPPQERTVFIQVRDTTDKNFNIENEVRQAVASRGYQIVDDPTQAHYYLQANVLSVGEADESAIENAGLAGFGGPLGGAAIGAVLGGDQAGAGAAIGAVAGGVAELVAGALVKVNNFLVITDLQLSERTNQGVSEEFDSQMKQGSANTTVTQRSAQTTDMKRYRTRIVSSARQTNLTWPEAEPYLKQGVAQAIGGIM